MLFDLQSDPHERVDLAADPRHGAILADYEAELRRLLDPDAVDRLAHSDQAAMVERTGGRDFILKRGAITYSPPPGVAPDLTPVESGRP
jgi:choline-sulfatase